MKRTGAFVLSLLTLAFVLALPTRDTTTVEAGPEATTTTPASGSMTVPFDSALQTLRTLEQSVSGKAIDAHGVAQPETRAAKTLPARKTAVLGPVYVDLMQRVAVRRPLPAKHRQLASRSGRPAYRIVHERRMVPVDISPIIRKHAERHRVDPFLVKAVIKAESDFVNSATSYCGAAGLMQLMPDTGAEMGARNLYEPEQNIAAGTRYLGILLRLYDGDMRSAVAAYNAGPGNVPRVGAIPNFSETRNYVKKVMKMYKQYKQEALASH